MGPALRGAAVIQGGQGRPLLRAGNEGACGKTAGGDRGRDIVNPKSKPFTA